jgi:hypothetical protein
MKENSQQPIILYPVKFYHQSEGEIMTSLDKQQLTGIISQ